MKSQSRGERPAPRPWNAIHEPMRVGVQHWRSLPNPQPDELLEWLPRGTAGSNAPSNLLAWLDLDRRQMATAKSLLRRSVGLYDQATHQSQRVFPLA